MNLEINKKVLDLFWEQDIKVYFYNSWCEGTKLWILTNFENKNLEKITISNKNIYFEKRDKNKLNFWKIFLDSTQKDTNSKNNKYIFISDKIKSRCGCSSSFSFENKLIDKEKLKKLKNIFKN